VGVALAVAIQALPARAQTADALKRAKELFDYGQFAMVIEILEHESVIESFPEDKDRTEAYKLSGLSHFFLGKPTLPESRQAAYGAFFNLLKQEPDYKLDPLFVPPDAVSFFESVKTEQEAQLRPIREFLRKKQLQDELLNKARASATLQSGGMERRLAVSSPVVALLPFGLGQFQNGNPSLGIGMAVGQSIAALTSLLSYLMIYVLRDPQSGEFKSNSLTLAQNFYISQWAGAGVFYALWIAGAIEASVRYVPERLLTQPPSAAPAGPLKPPDSVPAAATPAPVRLVPAAAPPPPPAVVPTSPPVLPKPPPPLPVRPEISPLPAAPVAPHVGAENAAPGSIATVPSTGSAGQP
jgi:hypothetical protein